MRQWWEDVQPRDLVLPGVQAALAALLTVYGTLLDDIHIWAQEKDASLIYEAMWKWHVPAMWILAISAGLLAVLPAMGRTRRAVTRERIRRHLKRIQRRVWPTTLADAHEVRVSLFVPSPRKDGYLSCLWRTDDKGSSKLWSMTPPDGLPADGVVGYIWLHQCQLLIEGLPDGATVDQKAAYLTRTFVTAERHDTLTWKHPCMLGVPVHGAGGAVLGVLLIECNRPGKALADAGTHQTLDTETCAEILEATR